MYLWTHTSVKISVYIMTCFWYPGQCSHLLMLSKKSWELWFILKCEGFVFNNDSMSRTEGTTVAQGTNPNFLCSHFLSLSQCHSSLPVSQKAPGFHFQLSCSFLKFYIAAQPTNVWPCRLLTAELQCWGFISQRLELSSHVTCDFRETGNDACGYLMTNAQMFAFKNSLLKPLCFDNVVGQNVLFCVAFHVMIKRNTMLFMHYHAEILLIWE